MRHAVSVAVGLLTIHVGLLAWSGFRHSPTVDEPAHLAAGISNWQFGRMDLYCVNPPLVRMVAALPVLPADPQTNWSSFRPATESRAEFEIGEAFADANGPRIFWLTTLARWACIPFSVLGGWVCYRWARELFGDVSGLVALSLWCFSPTILGNGSLITADVPAAALCVTTVYLFSHWLRRPSWPSGFATAVSLGTALLTKSSLILLCGLLPVLWVIFRVLSICVNAGDSGTAGTATGGASMRKQAVGLAFAIGSAMLILNLGYGFEGSGTRFGDFSFRSQALGGQRGEGGIGNAGNRFANSWIADLPVPFPGNYVIGIDLQKRDFETGLRNYLLGTIKTDGDGWWWFYLYAAAIKVPLGTWFLALMAIPVAVRSRNLSEQLLLLAPLMFFALLVSSQVGLNYFRYLLPAFPFAFIWSSQVFSTRVLQKFRAASLNGCIALTGCCALTWSVTDSLLNFPHSLAYFNELVGSQHGAHRIMADANLDWGQDLIYLREWIADDPSRAGLELQYFGPVDPVTAGLDVVTGNSRYRGPRAHDTPELPREKPEWLAVSATKLAHQVALQRAQGSSGTTWMEYLYNREPDARIGYTIHAYRLRD